MFNSRVTPKKLTTLVSISNEILILEILKNCVGLFWCILLTVEIIQLLKTVRHPCLIRWIGWGSIV